MNFATVTKTSFCVTLLVGGRHKGKKKKREKGVELENIDNG